MWADSDAETQRRFCFSLSGFSPIQLLLATFPTIWQTRGICARVHKKAYSNQAVSYSEICKAFIHFVDAPYVQLQWSPIKKRWKRGTWHGDNPPASPVCRREIDWKRRQNRSNRPSSILETTSLASACRLSWWTYDARPWFYGDKYGSDVSRNLQQDIVRCIETKRKEEQLWALNSSKL